jgi:hypothetical protein
MPNLAAMKVASCAWETGGLDLTTIIVTTSARVASASVMLGERST